MARARKASVAEQYMFLGALLLGGIFIAAYYLYPLIILGSLVIGVRAYARPPLSSPDDVRIDPLIGVENVLRAKQYLTMLEKQEQILEQANMLGLSPTAGSNYTRFDARKKQSNQINALLDEVEYQANTAVAEIRGSKQAIYNSLPNWRRHLAFWTLSRSALIAALVSLAVRAYVELKLGYLQTARVNPLGSGEGLIWAGVAFLIVFFSARFFIKRGHPSIPVVREWIVLERRWDPNDLYFELSVARDSNLDDEQEHVADEETTTEQFNDTGWRSVLGVNSEATHDEVKQRYRELIKQYHSDRVAGLGDKIKEVADTESKRLNAAYAEAKAELGFN